MGIAEKGQTVGESDSEGMILGRQRTGAKERLSKH